MGKEKSERSSELLGMDFMKKYVISIGYPVSTLQILIWTLKHSEKLEMERKKC